MSDLLPDVGDVRLVGLRGFIAHLGGARLCYGEPVSVGDRVVIPVARVNASGGGGYGSGTGSDEEGGGGAGAGGGGVLDAAPIGFIEVGPHGTRFEAIPDPAGTARVLRSAVGTAGRVAALVAGSRALRRRGRASGRSPRRSLRR